MPDCVSVASISAGWNDGGQFVEVELDDGLQRRAGGAVAQGFRECIEPGGIFGLQSKEQVDRIAPAPGAAAAIGGSPVLDHRLGCDTGDAMAGLSLGTTHQPASKLETAYHRADKAIQQIVDLLAA